MGSVVWNQCKPILINKNQFEKERKKDPSKVSRLIYNSDIINNKLELKNFSNDKKKNYIKKQGDTDIILVINRGYGKGDYKFNHCLIDTKIPYLIENHLICIRYYSKQNTEKTRELVKKRLLN